MNRTYLIFFVFHFSFFTSFAQKVDTVMIFQKDSLFRTKGAMAYLNYGLGDDRLGGAKMGYVDSLILLKTTGRYKDLYRVKLSNQLTAWVPVNLTKKDSTTKTRTQNLTGNWRVWGDDKYDYVSIPLPERLPYQSWQEVSPSKVIIDVFGVTTNTNWITQFQSVLEIENIDYEQVTDEQLRIKISLKHAQHWGYSVQYQGRRLVVSIKHQPPALKLKYLTVAIDAGHGGSNLGACGLRSKVCESVLNLAIAQKLKAELEAKGATVLMTRDRDTLIGNNDRILNLRKAKPDLLISIHNNSAADSVKIKGTSTYYKHLGFRPLSQAILKRVLELGVDEYGNVGRFNFALNSPTDYPNVLVEGLFLSQPDDEAKIIDPDFQQDLVTKITKGIEDWLKMIRKSGE
jgi:N-acetylmuramoyl-L-alanine amidase